MPLLVLLSYSSSLQFPFILDIFYKNTLLSQRFYIKTVHIIGKIFYNILLLLSVFTSKNLYNNENYNKKLIRICQIIFYKKTVVEAIFYLLYNGIKLLLFYKLFGLVFTVTPA